MFKDDDIPFKTGSMAGMTHKQIMEKAKKDDERQSKLKDPFAEGNKKYGSIKRMTKDSLKQLHKLSKNKK